MLSIVSPYTNFEFVVVNKLLLGMRVYWRYIFLREVARYVVLANLKIFNWQPLGI